MQPPNKPPHLSLPSITFSSPSINLGPSAKGGFGGQSGGSGQNQQSREQQAKKRAACQADLAKLASYGNALETAGIGSIDKLSNLISDGLFPGANRESRAVIAAILGNLPEALARARAACDQ